MRLTFSRRPRREKCFGTGLAVPLDGNAKARVFAYAEAWTAARRQRRQHRGPLTRATLDVLRALLWRFHNSRTGRCFPSYERIAEAARVDRATVHRAIAALEAAGILTWQNRLIHEVIAVPGLFGPELARVPRRTSNAYQLRDPGQIIQTRRPKSQNATGTPIQDSFTLETSAAAKPKPALSDSLAAALARLQATIEAREAASGGGGP